MRHGGFVPIDDDGQTVTSQIEWDTHFDGVESNATTP